VGEPINVKKVTEPHNYDVAAQLHIIIRVHLHIPIKS